jgi:poly(3-hydroxyalkanoate) synthetase
MQFFIKYNPSLALEKVKCPVLALNGDKDLQVPSKVNLHVAIIVPENITDIQIGTLKSRMEATSFKESIKAFTMIKTPDDFSKFIYDMNITDANIIMNVYDLLEMGYSQKGTKPIVLSVLQYKEIPQGLASGEKYIQRAINIPFINTTL